MIDICKSRMTMELRDLSGRGVTRALLHPPIRSARPFHARVRQLRRRRRQDF